MRYALTAISVCLLLVSGCSPTEDVQATADANAAEPARELTRDEKRELVAETLRQRGVQETGIYTVTESGQVEKMPIDVHHVELLSQNNENTSFTVTLRTSPFSDELAGKVYLYLGGRAYLIPLVRGSVMGGESINNTMCPSFRGEDVYGALVEAFDVRERLRRHPGHQFEATLLPTEEAYELREHPIVQFEITNTGEVAFFYHQDSEWDLTVTRNGETVPVREPDSGPISFSGFAGDDLISGFDIDFPLQPGESGRDTTDLTSKYDFPQPGTYQVAAACGIRIDVVSDGSVNGENAYLDVWDERLEFTFEFTIDDAD